MMSRIFLTSVASAAALQLRTNTKDNGLEVVQGIFMQMYDSKCKAYDEAVQSAESAQEAVTATAGANVDPQAVDLASTLATTASQGVATAQTEVCEIFSILEILHVPAEDLAVYQCAVTC